MVEALGNPIEPIYITTYSVSSVQVFLFPQGQTNKKLPVHKR